LIQLSQKYNLIYGLAITFSMVYPIRRKLNIQPDIAKSWTISPDAKPILYVAKGHLFSKAHFIW
jgi:peptide/nickel transport system substrate-binding protein